MNTAFSIIAIAIATASIAAPLAAQEHMMPPSSRGFEQLKPLVGEMSTAPVTGPVSEFSFSFVRATNLASPGAGHMHHLTVALQDHDHFSEAWTWNDNGKEHTEVFHFMRKS